MLNKKNGVKAANILLIIFASGGLIYIIQYYFSLKNQREKWYETEYLEKGFSGIIRDIEDYDYNVDFHNEFIGITIASTDSKDADIHYGMLSFKEEPQLKDFIEVGDSVFKNPNEKQVTFKKANGQTKTLILPIDFRK